MNLKIFSIRDTKGEIYNTPFFQKTHGEAERSFTSLMNDQNTMIAKYPEDFDLYFIGEFDDQSGKITHLDSPQHLVKAINLRKAEGPKKLS